jgi:hypothetical protein
MKMKTKMKRSIATVSLRVLFRLIISLLTVLDPKPALPAHPTAVMVALAAMPTVRNPVLRPNRSANTGRPSNMEALLGHMVGEEEATGCKHCTRARPAGVWAACVTVNGYFGGSCANCHYNNEGIRCSLRKFTSCFLCFSIYN